jgi:SNF2 family DNA or RNA helicase
MPLEEVAKGTGVRGAALRRGNVETAADVHRLSVEDLDAIPGVGPMSAQKIKARVSEFARTRAEDIHPPANPRKWTQADYALVRMLVMFAAAVALAPHVAVLQQALVGLQWLSRATGFLSWLFSSPSRKDRIRSEAPSIGQTWQLPQTIDSLQKLITGLKELEDVPHISDADIVNKWRSNSANLLSSLQQLLSADGTPEERKILDRGLKTRFSSDFLNQIESLALNTTHLIFQLRPYQKFGAKFAVVARRALLGDDMGLGKTIQALAAIAHSIEVDGERHHVVVCPASLIDTWLDQINKGLAGILSYRFHGDSRGAAFDEWQRAGGILVTSFQQVEHLLDRDHPPIGFAVFDEAHLVKNPETKRTQLAQSLAERAGRVLFMGGTLLENRAAELITIAGLANAREGFRLRRQFGDGRDAHLDAGAFRDALGDLYLRRNQDEVLTELPEIIPSDVYIDVGEPERLECKAALANRNLSGARRALSSGDGKYSSKMVRFEEIIDECRETQKKVLVFSQFLYVLDLCREIVGCEAEIIRGNVSPKKRSEIISNFEDVEDFAALIMQIDVGGVGYNLQAASVVILMEPQLKPSTEWQAIARAQRMGQTQPVIVYRLIAKDSIDERIVELSGFKAELFDELARRSSLAEAASELPGGTQDVNENELFKWAYKRYEL